MANTRAMSLVAAVEQQLQASPYWPIRQLVCHVDRDRITVRGCVSSYYLKQIAQSMAIKAVGTDRVTSEIEVKTE
jgi:hypothetical protein